VVDGIKPFFKLDKVRRIGQKMRRMVAN